MSEIKDLINAVVAEHGIRLDKDDPILITATIYNIIFDKTKLELEKMIFDLKTELNDETKYILESYLDNQAQKFNRDLENMIGNNRVKTVNETNKLLYEFNKILQYNSTPDKNDVINLKYIYILQIITLSFILILSIVILFAV